MNTTIQIDKATVQLLGRLKKKYGADSYKEVIRRLAEKEMKLPKSLFGADPDMKPFKREHDDHF